MGQSALASCSGSGVDKTTNGKMKPGPENQDAEGEIYMIVCGIDYACSPPAWSSPPLDTRAGFKFMTDLAKASSAKEIIQFWNAECNLYNVQEAIKDIGTRVSAGDHFIFYYTGHGGQLADQDGDEADGVDEAFVFIDRYGNPEPRNDVWLRDDDFANMITTYITNEAKILVIADACHANSIVDLAKPQWADFEAVALCGCKDEQTALRTGHGGIFTRALTSAIDKFKKEDKTGYPIANLWNETMDQYTLHKSENHTRNVQCHTTQHTSAQTFVWPLEPVKAYESNAFTDQWVEEMENKQ